MPKKRKFEVVRCKYFLWRLGERHGVWYADARSNPVNGGRHSLGTRDKDEALRLVHELDQQRAEDLGLAPKTPKLADAVVPLKLATGWALYEKHYTRPLAVRGVAPKTAKKYGSVFTKFEKFATEKQVTTWNRVSDDVLTEYAQHLEQNGYAHKSLVNELTTLKQALKWLIGSGHLVGVKASSLKVEKAESERHYCWRPEEVRAMLELLRTNHELEWLENVIVGLACTGLRISELASLRWVDVESVPGMVILSDERGHRERGVRQRRHIKSGRSRSFPIHADWAAVLKRLPRIDGYIYHGPRGGRLKPDTVRNVFVREVIMALTDRFPTRDGEKGFRDGRFHSFRHYFCSTCANSGVPERMVMDWLGHADSEMVRHYYHLHDEESRRRMNQLEFLGGVGGRSTDAKEVEPQEDAEPPTDDRKSA